MRIEHQIAILYCGTHGLLREVPLEKVPAFEKEFLSTLDISHRSDVLDPLQQGEINDKISAIIETVAADTVRTLKEEING